MTMHTSTVRKLKIHDDVHKHSAKAEHESMTKNTSTTRIPKTIDDDAHKHNTNAENNR